MNLAMKPCPSCREMLLADTPQCPSCGFVLDNKAAQSDKPEKGQWKGSSEEEKECASCHEMVRVGLVRCWSCGAFMQEEIAESYRQRIAQPRPIIYSVTQDDMISASDSVVQHSRSEARHRSHRPEDKSDDSSEDGGELDFEVSESVKMRQSQRPSKKTRAASGTSNKLPHVFGDEESGTYAVSGAPSENSAEDQPAEPTADAQPAAEGENGAAKPADAASDIAHSEATGGDVLLNVALAEEEETQKRMKTGRRRRGPSSDGVIVFCPNGHRIEVKERHRGMSGRCPKCKSLFVVPEQMWEQQADTIETSGASPAVEPQSNDPHTIDGGKFTRGLSDVALLVVDPQKLKLKPGSLMGSETLHDIYFSEENVMLVNLVKKAGLFGGADKKKQESRETLLGELKDGKPVAELSIAGQITIPVDKFRDIRVVQPVQYDHESMFAGVHVFGDGRIAILLPKTDEMQFQHYLSFPLSQFRDFCRIIRDLYGIEGLGQDVGVPMRDAFDEQKCHYTDQVLHILKNIEFYQADKSYTLQLIGRKCEGCGLIISEDGRKKEKIGGKTGSGIAKAKCPKCTKPFGKTSLFTLVEDKKDKPADEEPAAETTDEPPATGEPSAEASATAETPAQESADAAKS